MISVLLSVLLLDAENRPLDGAVWVDGKRCQAVSCALRPGRHVVDYRGAQHAFYLAPQQPAVRVFASSSAESYGVALRRSGSLPEPVQLPSVGPGQTQLYGYALNGDLPALRLASSCIISSSRSTLCAASCSRDFIS